MGPETIGVLQRVTRVTRVTRGVPVQVSYIGLALVKFQPENSSEVLVAILERQFFLSSFGSAYHNPPPPLDSDMSDMHNFAKPW